MNESDEVELSVMTVAHLAESLSPRTTHPPAHPVIPEIPKVDRVRRGASASLAATHTVRQYPLPLHPHTLPHSTNFSSRLIYKA